MRNIVRITMMIIFLIIILSTNIFAGSISEIFSTADSWTATGKANVNQTMDTTELKSTSDIIYNVFLAIGVAVAVIVGAILGIQFMTAGIDKKVQVKEALLPYVISCIVVFGSFGIWKLTVNILSSVEPAPSSTTQGATTSAQTQGSGTSGGSTTHQSSSGRTHGGSSSSF